MKSVYTCCLSFLIVVSGFAQKAPSVAESVPINGIDMYYEVYGEGEPLVLLHYTSGSTQIWQPFLDDFSEKFRLIVVDTRGHGRSTNPSKDLTLHQSALDVLALMDHLQIDRFKAIGLSGGGMIMFHVATLEPERVESMVLVGAGHYFGDEARAIQSSITYESRSDEWWEEMRGRHVHGDEQIYGIIDMFNHASVTYDDHNFTSPYLSTIGAKTLIVFGDQDGFFPVNFAFEMHEAIPNSYLWILPNAGHLPVFGDRRAEFTKHALPFLAGDWDK